MDRLPDRIAIDPAVMAGRPVVRGTRLTVAYLLGLLASGATTEEVLAEYPGLERDDLQACLSFAARALDDQTFVPLAA